MAALHEAGGVPRGWRLTPPPGDVAAGRQVFVDFGCFSCHTVQGEQFPPRPDLQNQAGPDLTGMGSHHPAAYFVESIMNPSAVLVDGPGYIGPDGRSIMPAYPEMTLGQLTDLVAYLQSLTTGGTDHSHSGGPMGTFLSNNAGASSFFVQAYEVGTDAKLEEFADWFEQEQFKAYDGLVSIDTYAGRLREGYILICLFGFTDDFALHRFLKGFEAAEKGRPSNDFVSPVNHYILRSPPVYRDLILSVP